MFRDDLAAVVIDTMAEGVCLVRTSDQTIVYANPRFTTLLGYTPGELDGKPVTSINYEQNPGDAERVARSIASQLLETGEAIYEVRNRRKDGSPLWCRARTTTIEHPQFGEVWVAVHSDIEAEKLLRRQELFLRTIAEQVPVGLWIIDEHGTITFGNAAGQQIWAGARYVGIDSYGQYRGWWADTGEPIGAEQWAAARAVRKRETSVGEVVRIQCFDGSFKTILHSAAPVIGEHDELFGAIVVNQDITRLQDAIHAREEILAVVAHDLRGPLNKISLCTAVLLADLGELAPPASARHSWLEGIARSVEEIGRQIEDLLDVARIERGSLALELSEVDVTALIMEALGRVTVHAGDRRLCTDCQAPLPVLVADRRRLLKVLDNLLGNAVKFTRSQDQITVGAAQTDGNLHVWVSDTGPGIAPEHLPLLFERGWQANPTDRRGAGLGLSIVRDIVRAHGGRVWATSEFGCGASFHVSLPLEPPRATSLAS
jgi:PAS domain S-box-containing protein